MNSITLPMLTATSALTMSSREIADLVESRHDKVKQSIERIAERGVITLPPMGEVSNNGLGPKLIKEYRLNKRESLIVVAQLCPEFTAAVIDRWQELEAQQSNKQFVVPQTLHGALRLAADLAEQKEQAEHERDIAIATKAQIGSRREATAMNAASQAKKEVERLEIELDKSKQYATIKRMEKLYPGQRFAYRPLLRASEEIGIAPIPVDDPNFGKVNTYHADAWQKAYARDIGGQA